MCINSLTHIYKKNIFLQIYLLDIHVFYTIMSAIVGFLLGARERLGEVSS
jgi:callose synthase